MCRFRSNKLWLIHGEHIRRTLVIIVNVDTMEDMRDSQQEQFCPSRSHRHVVLVSLVLLWVSVSMIPVSPWAEMPSKPLPSYWQRASQNRSENKEEESRLLPWAPAAPRSPP